MARNESDREDLMSEAVSLIRRIEMATNSARGPVIVGVNASGWLFVYIGQDLMYRFDEKNRLRRSFADGILYRTQGSTLASLVRQRTPDESTGVATTSLIRRDLGPAELKLFRDRMNHELTGVRQLFGMNVIARQHPADASEVVEELRERIEQVLVSDEFLAPVIVRR
jgi:hypothetical protein